MSDNAARDILSALGVNLRRVIATGEWRVCPKDKPEAFAYYTSSLDDAYSIGLEMAGL